MRDLRLKWLGQAGFRFSYNGTIIYIDPYLSNSVENLDGPDLKRLVEIPFNPESVNDADWVLISHEHIDHCDPWTLPKIAKASPQVHFVGPVEVLGRLQEMGISSEQMKLVAEKEWIELGVDIKLKAVPASHPHVERDAKGQLLKVGFILHFGERKLYFSGDTNVSDEVLIGLKPHCPIDWAILPVNEHNYFLEKRNILGNMSPREAFAFADVLGVKKLIPIHWDMFEVNSISPEEITMAYKSKPFGFDLVFDPETL